MPKTVGQMREEKRYHGNPQTSSSARARRTLDQMLTPHEERMKAAVLDTLGILHKTGEEMIGGMAEHLNSMKKKGKLKTKKTKKY